MTELVPASEPARRPALSPDPEQSWQPGPRRAQAEEGGPLWRHMEPAHVVLGMIAVVLIVMVILIVALVTHL